jgi:hypothetical protein
VKRHLQHNESMATTPAPNDLVREANPGSGLRKGANAYSQIVLRQGSKRSGGRHAKTGEKGQRNMEYIMRRGLSKNTGSLQDINEG